MDFNSLGENSPIYVIRKKPFSLETGVLKSKVLPQGMNTYLPQTVPQKIDITVTVGGSDEVVPGVPTNLEAVQYGNSIYGTTSDAAIQAITSLMQMAKAGIDEQPYYESLLTEGEKAIESLDPKYAENKRQAKVIKDLQERADKQDEKLDTILAKLDSLMS